MPVGIDQEKQKARRNSKQKDEGANRYIVKFSVKARVFGNDTISVGFCRKKKPLTMPVVMFVADPLHFV